MRKGNNKEMTKRKRTKKNDYPTYVGEHRECSSVLRDENGYIVIPRFTIDGEFVKYELTDLKDLSVKPDKEGKRGRVKLHLGKINDSHIVDTNYVGELFMYCRHCPNQELKPVSSFTTNTTQKTTYVHNDRLCRQAFCMECKQTYVNEGDAGNSSRTKDQMIEDNGARLRGLIEIVLDLKHKLDYKYIWNKFDGKCFKCNEFIPFDETDAKGLDHTLPHSMWWGLSNEDGTLLCSHKINGCNGSKSKKWPNIFYSDEQLVKLSEMTGIKLEILKGEPHYNSEVVEKFIDRFDDVMERWSHWGRYTRKNGENKYGVFIRRLRKEIDKLKEFDSDKNIFKLVGMLEKYYGENYE